MVEIFKKNIIAESQAGLVIQLLMEQWPQYQVNFDLEDCDHILRVEGVLVDNEKIIRQLNTLGYSCETLKDEVNV